MIFIGRLKKNAFAMNIDNTIIRGELSTLPDHLLETDRQIVIKTPYNLTKRQYNLLADSIHKMGFKHKSILLEGGADIKLL